MAENHDATPGRRSHWGVFWPFLLISLGLVFLFNNIGLIQGDLWQNLLRFWPLLLVLMGLDGFLRREGLVASTLAISLGVIFLLSNFGIIVLGVMGVLIRIWPLILVAGGFDLLFGRRSWLASIIGILAILTILGGTLYLMGVQATRVELSPGVSLSLPLGEAGRAKISVDPGFGSLRLSRLQEMGNLIEAAYPGGGDGYAVTHEHSVTDGLATLTLHGSGRNFFLPRQGQGFHWDVKLTTEVPVDLQIDLGAGDIQLDLSGLILSGLDLELGVGSAVVTLPASGDFQGKLAGAVGTLVVIVPPGVGVQLDTDTGLAAVQPGAGFVIRDGMYETENFDTAEHQIILQISQAIGTVELRQQ